MTQKKSPPKREIKKQKVVEHDALSEESRQFRERCTKQGNRNILNRLGDELYIKHYGEENYKKIINNTDTEIFMTIRNQ